MKNDLGGLSFRFRSEYQVFKAAQRRCAQGGCYFGHVQFRFDNFSQFLNELGPRPAGMHNGQAVYSVDRKNNDGDYAPGNVRWATRKEQQENKRKVASLRSFTVAELVAELKLRGVTCGS